MSGAYIGVDVGTSSARAGAFDASGRLLASARRPIKIWREAGEMVEHSSADIWRAACAAVREAASTAGLAPRDVRGIGFDATCSLVTLDGEGGSLAVSASGDSQRDTVVWMDHRAVAEADEINTSRHPALRYVGGAISPEMQPPKLLWLSRHAPETFARARHFFDLTDFLTYRATGSPARSACTVACKWLYHAHEGRWPSEFYEAIGLSALMHDISRIGAEVVAPGTALGQGLLPEAAAAMGLEPGLCVGAGLIDAHAGALGTIGGVLPGVAADPRRRLALILGTSSCCMALSEAPHFIAGVWGPHFSGLAPGEWLIEGGQSAFGAAIDHLLHMHPAYAEYSGGADGGFEALERDIISRAGGASQAATLARELHVLPDFLGSRSPYADPSARAAIVGLDLREDRASLHSLYIAGLCGLAQGVAQVIRTLESGGLTSDMLVASGGASRSALVRQIVADVTGKRVVKPETDEPVLLGAAMLGAVAAGDCDIRGAMATMSRLGEVTESASGAIANLHADKRRAFESLQRIEREIRGTARTLQRRAVWPRLAIFDCDGVLVDSETIALARTRGALARLGLKFDEEQARDQFLGVSAQTMRAIAEVALGGPLPIDFQEELALEIMREFERSLRGIEGIREAVAALGAPVCVASSSSHERVRASLRIVGYDDLFERSVFSSSDVARGKPAPDLLLLAASSFGVEPSDCLVIEDSVPGVIAARSAGMTVFGFTGGAHAKGEAYRKRLTNAGACLVFDDMRELRAHVLHERETRGAGSRDGQER